KPQKLNRRQARWLTELQEYHFTLHHIPGKSNSKADLLSRRHGFDQVLDDNDHLVLLSPAHFRRLVLCHMVSDQASYDLTTIPFHARIHRAHHNLDKVVKRALERKETGWKVLEDGTCTFKDRVYVPVDKKLHEDIIREHHDSPLAGHPGRYKTAELILRDYWWPQLQRDVRAYIEGCETCQRTKPHRTPTATPLHPFQPPSRPWDTITIDIIGPI